MKKEKNNSNKKIVISTIIVLIIAILAFGATYAYWTWQSSVEDKTEVSFTITKPNFTITGTNISSSNLAPTSNCANQIYALKGNATVTAENNTTTPMRASITLNGRLTPVTGRNLSTEDKQHIHWAIKEVESEDLTNYVTANCTSTVNTTTYATGNFAAVGTADTDIATTITFDVTAGQTAVKYYQIYAWIDGSYERLTTGSTITDPMQNLNLRLTFSENSTFNQL